MSAARILVVDDHATNRKLVTDLVQFEGYEVLQAADADAAEHVIRATRPALILMDIAMPGRDGREFTRQLNANPATRRIIVVALTAFPKEYSRAAAPGAGCDAYFVKPVSTCALPGILSPIAAIKETSPS